MVKIVLRERETAQSAYRKRFSTAPAFAKNCANRRTI